MFQLELRIEKMFPFLGTQKYKNSHVNMIFSKLSKKVLKGLTVYFL